MHCRIYSRKLLTLIYYKYNTVKIAGMKGFGREGKWVTSSVNSFVEAHLKKDAGSPTVTLDISKSIHKVGTMTTKDSELKASRLLGKCA